MHIIFVTQDMYDNRDDRTTWVHISNTITIELDPQDLFFNMLENCYEGRNLDADDLEWVKGCIERLKGMLPKTT